MQDLIVGVQKIRFDLEVHVLIQKGARTLPLSGIDTLLASASLMIDMALLARHQNLLLQEITPFPHLSTTMSIVHYQLRQLQEAGTSTRVSARPIHLATCYKCGEKGHYTNKCGRRHLGLLAGH